jgi:mitofusin
MFYDYLQSRLSTSIQNAIQLLHLKKTPDGESLLSKEDFTFLSHIQTRVRETRSKILVVGDVNAGKSTLVNSLIRKRLVPVDQQPCTSAFLELLHGPCEEIHAVTQSTFLRYPINHLHELVEAQGNSVDLFRIFIQSSHFLRDASIIDSPGLNINNVTTVNLFSKQQEIDVIVFVISSENHITQSVL